LQIVEDGALVKFPKLRQIWYTVDAGLVHWPECARLDRHGRLKRRDSNVNRQMTLI
jgi:hypothetical protein